MLLKRKFKKIRVMKKIYNKNGGINKRCLEAINKSFICKDTFRIYPHRILYLKYIISLLEDKKYPFISDFECINDQPRRGVFIETCKKAVEYIDSLKNNLI